MVETQIVRGIVERIAEIREATTALEAEQNMLWTQFYGYIDDTHGAGEPFRWTHPDLKITIGRVMAENSPILDQGKLQEILTPEEWQAVTKQVRSFDLDRLEAQVGAGKIKADDVAEATTQAPPTTRKHFKPASKTELLELASKE